MHFSNSLCRTACLLAPALTAGCVGTKHQNFQPSQLPSIGDDKGTYLTATGIEKDWINNEVARFVDLNEKAQTDPKHIKDFVYVGLNVSDQLANRWFRTQFAVDVESRYANNTFNVVASGATAILGVTSASHKAISLLGAGTTAANAQWKNYEASYLLSSALPLVLEKLREYRKERRNEIIDRYDSDSTRTYHEAVDELRNYHQTASREVIKRFIEKSAELAEFTTKYDAEGSLKGIQVLPLNTALFSLFYPKTAGMFAKNDLIRIYALVSQARPNNLIAAIEATASGKHLSDLVQSISGTPEGKAELIKLISGLNGMLFLEEDVRKQLKIVDAAAKARDASAKTETASPQSTTANAIPSAATTKDELQKLASASTAAAAAANSNKTAAEQKQAEVERAKAAVAEKSSTVEKEAALAKVAATLLAEKKAALDEARKGYQAALTKEAALREEADRAKKLAQDATKEATASADAAQGAYFWKEDKAAKARSSAEKARSADASVQAKIAELAKAVAESQIASTLERELTDSIRALEKNLTEAKAAEAAAKSEESRLKSTLNTLESAAKTAAELAKNAAVNATEALAAERKARERAAAAEAAAAVLNAAKAAPLLDALEKKTEPASSGQPRVQSAVR